MLAYGKIASGVAGLLAYGKIASEFVAKQELISSYLI